MRQLRKLFRNHSPYLVFITICEILLSVIATMSFVYTDRLSYGESEIFSGLGIEKLLESIYSSTWWALILLILIFIAIFSLATIVYKKLEYLFFANALWIVMLILAINLNNSLFDNLSVILIATPILILNSIAYKTEKIILNKRKKEKNEESISKVDAIGYTIMVIFIISIMLFLINTFIENKKNDNINKTSRTEVTTTETITTVVTTKQAKKK